MADYYSTAISTRDFPAFERLCAESPRDLKEWHIEQMIRLALVDFIEKAEELTSTPGLEMNVACHRIIVAIRFTAPNPAAALASDLANYVEWLCFAGRLHYVNPEVILVLVNSCLQIHAHPLLKQLLFNLLINNEDVRKKHVKILVEQSPGPELLDLMGEVGLLTAPGSREVILELADIPSHLWEVSYLKTAPQRRDSLTRRALELISFTTSNSVFSLVEHMDEVITEFAMSIFKFLLIQRVQIKRNIREPWLDDMIFKGFLLGGIGIFDDRLKPGVLFQILRNLYMTGTLLDKLDAEKAKRDLSEKFNSVHARAVKAALSSASVEKSEYLISRYRRCVDLKMPRIYCLMTRSTVAAEAILEEIERRKETGAILGISDRYFSEKLELCVTPSGEQIKLHTLLAKYHTIIGDKTRRILMQTIHTKWRNCTPSQLWEDVSRYASEHHEEYIRAVIEHARQNRGPAFSPANLDTAASHAIGVSRGKLTLAGRSYYVVEGSPHLREEIIMPRYIVCNTCKKRVGISAYSDSECSFTVHFCAHCSRSRNPKTVARMACPICFSPDGEDMVLNGCGHAFCDECMAVLSAQETTCPLCRDPIRNEKRVPIATDTVVTRFLNEWAPYVAAS